MKDSASLNSEETACPKRLWVLTTLSDDEWAEDSGALPHGLQFHLSRCPSCQTLADRLLAASASLGKLGNAEPPSHLAERAEAQVIDALKTGGRLSGRVTIPDEVEPPSEAPAVVRWVLRHRYAAAAALVFAVGLWQAPSFLRPATVPVSTVGAPIPAQPGVTVEPARNLVPDPVDTPLTEEPRLAVETTTQDEPSPTAEPASDENARMVRAAWPHGNSRTDPPGDGRAPRRICQHRTHIEAAMCDNVHDVHTAVVLPRRLSRGAANRARRIDKRSSSDSTGRGPGGR